MGCEALATKAELAAVKAQLEALINQKIDRSEKQPIIQQSIAGAIGALDPKIAIIAGALATLRAIIAALAPIVAALGPLVPFVATLIAIAAIFYDLYQRVFALAGRLGIVEKRVDAHDVQIRTLNIQVEIAKADASAAKKEASIAQVKAIAANIKADKAIEQSNVAIKKANTAIEKSNIAIKKADAAIVRSNQAWDKATEANQTARSAIAKANAAHAEAIAAKAYATEAINKANNAYDKALVAIREANIAKLEAILAQRKAQDAFDKALMAIDRAFKAQKQADIATSKANQAANWALEALGLGNVNAQDIGNLDSDSRNGNITKRWQPRIWEPVTTNIQNRVDQQVKPIPIQMGNFERSQKELKENIEKQFAKLPTFEEALARSRAEIRRLQGDFSTFGNTSSAAKIAETNKTLTGEINRLKAKDKELATGIGTVGSKINDLERTTANTNTQVQTLTNTQANTQSRLREQEKVNTEANKKLTDVGTQIGNLPNILVPALGVAIPAIIVNSPSIRRMLTDTSVEAGCQLAQPQGCLGKQFTNLGNQISNNASNILNGINTGANAAQLLLLKQVDAKLGAQITGGLSGGVGRLSSFLGIDRVFNLINFLANLHNASMLSASLKVTLLETLSSVGNATGLLETSEGDNVDLNSVFNQGIESFVTSLIGTEAWASMKLTWRKYSTIYRAATNSLNAVSSMFNSIGQAVETSAEYTGKIGNALKAAGAIHERAYNFMAEKFEVRTTNKFMAFQSKVGDVTQVLETVNEIAQNVVEGQQQYTEAVKATQEFQKQLADAKKNPGIDNKAIKEEAEKIKEKSIKDPTGDPDKGLLSFLTD